mmetsp:Transcript_35880/g.94039  ORF Transcript_35880/g.94039 Transcript_35880/m.94039 type:complete len:382 (-) Transcript_35880:40-1185(-)
MAQPKDSDIPLGRQQQRSIIQAQLSSGLPKGTRFAAVELGGMSIRVAIAEDSPENIVDRKTYKTLSPADTIPPIVEWLRERQPFSSLGIASFGPIDPRPESKTFGFITSTPKVEWRNFDLYGAFDVFGVPMAFDTDVNAPALFEYLHHRQFVDPRITSCAYITVGTGVGIGLVINGKPVHGLLHPEAGHIPYPRLKDDPFNGLAGYAVPEGCEANSSAVALAQRAGLDSPDGLKDLPDDHPVWEKAVHYLAGVCVSIILVASAEKIVIGGGVLNRKSLFPAIRKEVQRVLNGYIQVESITTDQIEQYIVPAIHENDAGIIGALALSEAALAKSEEGGKGTAAAADAAAGDGDTKSESLSYLTSAVVGALTALALHRMLPKL